MTRVVKIGNTVRRSASPASSTIQKFLYHLRSQGVDWVPEPLGFDEAGNELFSFIEGQCVEAIPTWFWNDTTFVDVAKRLRQYHDASASFPTVGMVWNSPSQLPEEVIVHRDFAPYNCIFRDEQFVGLIDFDLCSPGPRIWDIAYAAYRFVPLMPDSSVRDDESWAISPFSELEMFERLEAFLEAYSGGNSDLRYSSLETILVTISRLAAMVEWIDGWVRDHPNSSLLRNKATYSAHREWLIRISTL